MTSLNKEDLIRLAKLADIQITDSEISEIAPQLTEIVNFFDQLKEVDTSNVEPTSQTTGLVDVLRDDEIDVTRIIDKSEEIFSVDALLDKNKNKS